MESVVPSPQAPQLPATGRVVALMHMSANQTGAGAFTVDALREGLRTRGLDGDVIALGPDDDAAETARRLSLEHALAVIAVGGDGMIHDVTRGLRRAGLAGGSAAFGVLPAGTMNNVAATLGIPENPEAALDSLAGALRTKRFRPLDLGQIGDMTFIEEAGFGMLSELMRIGESVKQNNVSVGAAAAEFSKTIKAYQPAPLTLVIDGARRHFQALHVVICNAPVIAMRLNVAPGARMDDGLLDVTVYERYQPIQLLAALAQRIGGRAIQDARARRFRARTVLVEPSQDREFAAWPIEVDGELAGDCGPDGRWRRIEVRALPGALRLAALPAPARLVEQPWRITLRAVSSTLKRNSTATGAEAPEVAQKTPEAAEASASQPSAPTAAAASAIAAVARATGGAPEGVVESAVGPVAQPPRRAARRLRLIRTLYLVGGALGVGMGIAASRASLLPGDMRITRALQRTRTPARDHWWRAVAWAGFPGPTAIVVTLTTALLWLMRFRLEAVFMMIATGVNAVNFALKRIVRRERPAESAVRVLRIIKEPSFPSGHVMFYTSAFGFLVAAALANLRPSALRRGIVGLGSALIGLVGPSRVYLGAHWPSDVAAGYLFGGMYLGGVLQVYTWAKSKQAHEASPIAAPASQTLGASANELSAQPDLSGDVTGGR